MARARQGRGRGQLGLAARGTWGGFRANAGRKPKAEGDHRGHRARPALAARYPVHLTLKVRPSVPNLRRQCFRAVRAALVAGKERHGFRLCHFTVQGNHLHLVCEASDQVALSRGVQGLAIRIARRVNKQTRGHGPVFAERYHERILRSPTQVRRTLAYVLNHSRRHAPQGARFARGWIDPRSSAPWFDGWQGTPRLDEDPGPDRPVVPATTWLLTTGWRRHGLIPTDETPGDAPPRG